MSVAANAPSMSDPVPAPQTGGAPRILLALALLLAVGIAGWPLAADFLDRPVRSVRIAGDFVNVPRGALESVIEPHIASGFARIGVDAVREEVARLPWVRQVSVRRVWPDSLHVAIVERVPVARWGADGLLEADATVFVPETVAAGTSLPALSGPEGSAPEVLAMFVRLDGVVRGIGDRVTEVALSGLGGWEVGLAGGTTLVMDARVDPAMLERYLRGFPRLFGSRLHEVERVDLRYTNGFAVRWREAPAAQEGHPS